MFEDIKFLREIELLRQTILDKRMEKEKTKFSQFALPFLSKSNNKV